MMSTKLAPVDPQARSVVSLLAVLVALLLSAAPAAADTGSVEVEERNLMARTTIASELRRLMPAQRNALSNEVLDGLVAALDDAEFDAEVRAVVLTGGSKLFA